MTPADAGRLAHAMGEPIDSCPYGSDPNLDPRVRPWRLAWNEAEIASLTGRDPLLTPGEVAQMFRVDPKTVTRWANQGRIASIRTVGGHRRFRRSVVMALLRGEV